MTPMLTMLVGACALLSLSMLVTTIWLLMPHDEDWLEQDLIELAEFTAGRAAPPSDGLTLGGVAQDGDPAIFHCAEAGEPAAPVARRHRGSVAHLRLVEK